MRWKRTPTRGKTDREVQRASVRRRNIREGSRAGSNRKDDTGHLESLINQPITPTQRQAAVLQLQLIRGNAYVLRMLGKRTGQEEMGQDTGCGKHLKGTLWGKVRMDYGGKPAGGLQRAKSSRTAESPRIVAWGLQRKTNRWGKGNHTQSRRTPSSRNNDGGMALARRRIRRLRVASRKLRQLARPFGTPTVRLKRSDEATTYSNWLFQASASLGSLASDWSDTIESQASGGSESAQLMIATQEMAEMNQSFNLQYLQLQQKMQSDNRKFTAMSNIMKTKHDTAKSAINNVR